MRAGKRPEEHHWGEHPRRSEYSDEGDEPLQYPLAQSTSFHSEDNGILFESTPYPDSPARRPSKHCDASSSDYYWNPPAYGQPSAKGEASSSSPQLGVSCQNTVGSESPHSGLKRIDTDKSTTSVGSLSSIALTDPLELDYVTVPDYVKVPNRHKKNWLHPFG